MLEGPKQAKRKLVCRGCGKTIPRGWEYWVEKWLEGPYLRRQVLCRDCARRVFLAEIEWLVVEDRRRAIDECVKMRLGKLKVPEYLYTVLSGKKEEYQHHCMKEIDKHGYYVVVNKRHVRQAEALGIDLEQYVKQKDKAAKLKVL